MSIFKNNRTSRLVQEDQSSPFDLINYRTPVGTVAAGAAPVSQVPNINTSVADMTAMADLANEERMALRYAPRNLDEFFRPETANHGAYNIGTGIASGIANSLSGLGNAMQMKAAAESADRRAEEDARLGREIELQKYERELGGPVTQQELTYYHNATPASQQLFDAQKQQLIGMGLSDGLAHRQSLAVLVPEQDHAPVARNRGYEKSNQVLSLIQEHEADGTSDEYFQSEESLEDSKVPLDVRASLTPYESEKAANINNAASALSSMQLMVNLGYNPSSLSGIIRDAGGDNLWAKGAAYALDFLRNSKTLNALDAEYLRHAEDYELAKSSAGLTERQKENGATSRVSGTGLSSFINIPSDGLVKHLNRIAQKEFDVLTNYNSATGPAAPYSQIAIERARRVSMSPQTKPEPQPKPAGAAAVVPDDPANDDPAKAARRRRYEELKAKADAAGIKY